MRDSARSRVERDRDGHEDSAGYENGRVAIARRRLQTLRMVDVEAREAWGQKLSALRGGSTA
jgi:hypothetical protein